MDGEAKLLMVMGHCRDSLIAVEKEGGGAKIPPPSL